MLRRFRSRLPRRHLTLARVRESPGRALIRLRSGFRSGMGRPGRSLARARQSLRERRIMWTLLLAGFAVLCISAVPFVGAHVQALTVLQLMSGKPVSPILARLVTQGVVTQDLQLETESGPVRGRLYLPASKANAPAMIVLHGVHHLGIDEPRLEAFASGLASCGIQVLTPELPDIKDYHVDQSSIQTIGQSTQWFAQRTGGPVGVMGLSFSGGLALVAAGDPLYGKDFKFVFAVGAQDRMDRVAQYYRTGEDVRPNGTTELLPAHEYGPLVLEYEYLEDFVPRSDVAPLRAVLRSHLYEDKFAEAKAAARLNEREKSEALELMDATSPGTRAAIARVTAKHTAEMEGLSPGGRLKRMTTPVYLLHGEADNIIPSAETLWMASELPAMSLQAMLVSPVISHIDFEGREPGALDHWRLVHFFALVLHAAERK